MNELRRNVMVGLFVLVGLSAAVVLVILFGRGPTWLVRGGTYPLFVRFQSATGIKSGTLVTVYGKTIGRVESIEFMDPVQFGDGVRVQLGIENQYQLHAGSRADTVEPGIGAGRPPIQIVPGPASAPVLAGGTEIPGTMSTSFESLVPPELVATLETTATRIGDAAKALTPVLEDIHVFLQPRSPDDVDKPDGPQGNLSSAMARLDAGIKHLNIVMGDPQVQSNLRDSIANMRKISEDGAVMAADLKVAAGEAREGVVQFKALAEKGQGTLAKLDDNVERVGRATIDGLDKAGRAFDQLVIAGTAMNKGEGTLGKLMKDDRLYEAAVLSFRRLAETLEEFSLVAKDWQQGKIRIAF